MTPTWIAWILIAVPGFPSGEKAPTPKVNVLTYYFENFLARNCMRMNWIYQWIRSKAEKVLAW